MSIRMLTLTAALLVGGGCVSYSYHSGYGGDYYSGTPSVEYRYVGGYYGYSPYWYGGYGYPGYYGHPGYYGYPYYGHRYHGYYGYGGGYPYYYGGAWGYSHGPYKPPRQDPPPVAPPPTSNTSLRYLDNPQDHKPYPGHRDSAGRPYGVPRPLPPNYAGGNVRPPSRPVTPPPSQQILLPPPSAPRVLPPSRPMPVAPAAPRPAVAPAGPEARSTPYSPKGATRARSRSIDPDDP